MSLADLEEGGVEVYVNHPSSNDYPTTGILPQSYVLYQSSSSTWLGNK
jgi:hypothetical protein